MRLLNLKHLPTFLHYAKIADAVLFSLINDLLGAKDEMIIVGQILTD